MGMRLGVAGTSTFTDVVGDVLRRFGGEKSIDEVSNRIALFPSPSAEFVREFVARSFVMLDEVDFDVVASRFVDALRPSPVLGSLPFEIPYFTLYLY